MRNEEECRLVAVNKAIPYGLENEVAQAFDHYVSQGDDPEEALFCALYDWDL